jgi:agmatinase
LCEEVLEVIQALVQRSRGRTAGIDLVGVDLEYDPACVRTPLSAQLLLNPLGFFFHVHHSK